MNLEDCKRNQHTWETVFNTEGIMDDGGEAVEWCPLCGSIRVITTLDHRHVKTTVFRIPQAVKELDAQSQNNKPS